MTPERKFRTTKVDPFLKSLGNCKDFSIQQVALRGVPDKLCCINGFFVAIEIKAEKGKLSKLQEFTLKQVKKANGVAMVVSPANWDQAKELLLKISEYEWEVSND